MKTTYNACKLYLRSLPCVFMLWCVINYAQGTNLPFHSFVAFSVIFLCVCDLNFVTKNIVMAILVGLKLVGRLVGVMYRTVPLHS
jgi:hypothetical protein